MQELTVDNAIDYLRVSGRITGAAHVEALSGGVSNLVLRVTTDTGPFILKQSRSQLRTRAPWFSDLERVFREQEVMQALKPFVPAGMVPEVLFVDRPNFIFAMSHAPLEALVWKDELLAGRVDDNVARRVGGFLGLMHETSVRNRDRFEPFRDSQVFQQLRVEPFYRTVAERRPEVAQAIAMLIDEMLTRAEALCHGDYTPKKMLVHSEHFTLVDYETAYLGDPAMDIGLCLAHLVLKAFRRPAWGARYLQLMRCFWDGYRGQVTFQVAAELEGRAIAHLGACLLARIDGTSPVEYLGDEATRDAVRALGRQLLLDGVRRWRDVELLVIAHAGVKEV